ncbi:MAG TPA: prolyl oligopeptidase family serine peptidase [Bacteroidales bacterium]|nr:prolyl oligopeptidase family serine peptidase [Bacteroidales bacterium]HPJ59100.1 prolyl oligopeptidase family serine peptidase [Bacteroidales bacterium]HPR11399.1 prolyl oligopeptidase family serine peptidase [Bacteroidales bacterium]
MKPRFILITIMAASAAMLFSQGSLKYQLPPAEIIKIVDAPPTPSMSVSPDHKNIIIIDRPSLITIGELSQEELRLAGLRINPALFGPSRQTWNREFRIMNIDGTNIREISGMPQNKQLGSPRWAPDGTKFAFTNATSSALELWVCDVASLTAKRVADRINAVFGAGLTWLSDSKSLVFLEPADDGKKRPVRTQVPEGPVVQESLGEKGQAATYQDLLRDPTDEAIFEYFATSRLMLWDGVTVTEIGRPAIYTDYTPSPDGNYLMVTKTGKPFSYTVPYYYFPSATEIWDMKGKHLRTLLDKPLIENLPRGYDVVLPGPRSFSWRSDKPATMTWVEALDNGDYSNEMTFHDQVYLLEAPFSGEAVKFIATQMRFSGITWGRDDYAVINEGLSRTRMRVVSSFSPALPQETKKKLFEYNSDDRYNNPGSFLTAENQYGRNQLLFTNRGRSLLLSGRGSSPQGDNPFLDRYDLSTGKITRLWQSKAPYYESVSEILDIEKGLILTNRQSLTEVPNYFIRNIRNGKISQVTRFENPYPQLVGIHKELVKYKRNDSLDLSFTLYLPSCFDRTRDKPLPTLLWAYPREFNDPSAAGQVSGSPYTFTRISPASALVYVTQGYAVLMDASFPIVGTGGKEPNDTFVEQLVANAEAAINKAVEMGVTDPRRVAVSGHSYGAFMTANLLAHSRLFAAGIAESGAYNRTLTPFGFQNERRTYWEAPHIYNTMSPFMNADKVKDPIMLIHGIADNNSGTFPVQSERFYAALKGHGAVVRLVMLPNESHGYAARETILHKHWEVLNWMNKYVRDRK